MADKAMNKTFAAKLNQYLGENDRTQLELAKYLNVSGATVSNWCKGSKMPRMDKINGICEFLNIKPSNLMEEGKTNDETVLSNPDIRMIARAGKKMTDAQAETLRKYAEFMFPEAFDD